MYKDFQNVKAWIFDLDDTLYHPDSGVNIQLNKQVKASAAKLLGVDWSDLEPTYMGYRKKYGVAFTGLHLHHPDFDMTKFIEMSYDLDLSGIKPCDKLKALITSLPGKKAVFTNSPRFHADRVLGYMGMDGVFDHIFDVTYFNFRGKPNQVVYDQIVQDLGVDPGECVLVEDSVKNLIPAHKMGMKTVLVNQEQCPDKSYISHHFVHFNDFIFSLFDVEVSDN